MIMTIQWDETELSFTSFLSFYKHVPGYQGNMPNKIKSTHSRMADKKTNEVITKECAKCYDRNIHMILTWQPSHALSPDWWTQGRPPGRGGIWGILKDKLQLPRKERMDGHCRWKSLLGSLVHKVVFSRPSDLPHHSDPFRPKSGW